ncbi:related to PBN1 protein, required for post-translational processing of the protease B precursor Prb1p [Phialocephala subalpina]|uniref:Protein PBN1 n=1 Tax=Phialocephala subalpina TaxID=576137 RepID=A0A1L7WPT7_9HELO|nr:related to PBN1 protein, required for post-translational processing of the protease B precursor Prb1p [Phialocephala subalpina]
MRQRITYLQEPNDAVDPKNLQVTNNSISTKELKAAREERITFGFDELPQELYTVLKASHELHIRWARERAYESIAPLVSRLSPGLHVFYTPQRGSKSSDLLCPILEKVFGGNVSCKSPETSFTILPTERFSHSAATQFYTPLASLDDFRDYLAYKLCPVSDSACQSRVSSLSKAASLDISFDTISHAFTLSAFFPSTISSLAISKPKTSSPSRLEVGILNHEKATDIEELSMAGFLTVIGENTKPSPTLFSFPSRHHPSTEWFSSKFLLPTGLHPNLELSISGSQPPLDDRSCSLHAHITLPRQVFADKYQLSDPLFLASKNLTAVRYITSPVDLEAPAYTMDIWGSSVLLELAPPSSSKSEAFTAQVPLHLRYLEPNAGKGGLEQTEIPYPVLFWACTADEGSKFPINPFDRVNLGYDGLFGPRTLFFHLSPTPSIGEERLTNKLEVPVLDLDKSSLIEIGTAAVVGLGFLWVLWVLVGVWRRSGYGSRTVVEKEKKSQ